MRNKGNTRKLTKRFKKQFFISWPMMKLNENNVSYSIGFKMATETQSTIILMQIREKIIIASKSLVDSNGFLISDQTLICKQFTSFYQ